MSTLYTFFISTIVLEVLCLVGIVVAFRKLHQWKVELLQAKVGLARFRFEFSRTMRNNTQTLQHADTAMRLILGFAPPWLKLGLTVLRWVGKIAPKTS